MVETQQTTAADYDDSAWEEDLVEPIRRAAGDSRFRVASYHPEATRVDGDTWWLAFREGVHWQINNSDRLRMPLEEAAQIMALLDQNAPPEPESSDEFRRGARWAILTGSKISAPLLRAARLIALLAQPLQSLRCPHCGMGLHAA